MVIIFDDIQMTFPGFCLLKFLIQDLVEEGSLLETDDEPRQGHRKKMCPCCSDIRKQGHVGLDRGEDPAESLRFHREDHHERKLAIRVKCGVGDQQGEVDAVKAMEAGFVNVSAVKEDKAHEEIKERNSDDVEKQETDVDFPPPESLDL